VCSDTLFAVLSLTSYVYFRLRILREEPHSQQLAERAIGLGLIDNGKREENPDVMKD
jgi:hypothetical protein